MAARGQRAGPGCLASAAAAAGRGKCGSVKSVLVRKRERVMVSLRATLLAGVLESLGKGHCCPDIRSCMVCGQQNDSSKDVHACPRTCGHTPRGRGDSAGAIKLSPEMGTTLHPGTPVSSQGP